MSEPKTSAEFSWPPRMSDDDIVWLEPETKNEAPAAPNSAAPAASAKPVLAVSDLLSNGVPFEWYEAVALVQQLAVEAGATNSCRGLIEFDMIELQADGRLRVKIEAGFTPIVRSLGHLLHHLLTLRPGPANLRLLALQAASDVATFESSTDFTRVLSNFERPGRLKILEALYERAASRVPSPGALATATLPAASIDRAAGMAASDADLARLIEADAKRRAAGGWMARTARTIGDNWSAMSRSTRVAIVSSVAVSLLLAGMAAVLFVNDQQFSFGRTVGERQAERQVVPEPKEPSTQEAWLQKPNSAPAPVSPLVPNVGARVSGPANIPLKSVSSRPANTPSLSASVVIPRKSDALAPLRTVALPGLLGAKVPPVAEEEFLRALSLFQRRDYAAAAAGFQRVIGILSNGELTPASSNMRTSAADLAARSRAALSDSHIYASGDDGVSEPVPFRKYLPEDPAPGVSPEALSVLELVIDREGAVESARLRSSTNRFREAWLASAAKTWRFQPAVKDGHPVKFRKRILITSFMPAEPQ